MLQWIELTTKQFNACPAACEWFLDTMAEDDWWPQQILIKCPNQVVRQMFQRLIIHVIQQLRNKHVNLYLHPMSDRFVMLPSSLKQSCHRELISILIKTERLWYVFEMIRIDEWNFSRSCHRIMLLWSIIALSYSWD